MPDNKIDNLTILSKSVASQLRLDNFMDRVQKHRTDIAASQGSVLYALDLFSESEGVWPDNCDQVIDAMRKMGEPIREFCGLLDSHTQLPVAVSPLRFPLMKTLYHVDELVNELSLLLTIFRPVCRIPSRKVFTQRREIQRKLESLAQSLEEIDQNVDKLPERIDFQERLLSKLIF
jgi:hypothetical protein